MTTGVKMLRASYKTGWNILDCDQVCQFEFKQIKMENYFKARRLEFRRYFMELVDANTRIAMQIPFYDGKFPGKIQFWGLLLVTVRPVKEDSSFVSILPHGSGVEHEMSEIAADVYNKILPGKGVDLPEKSMVFSYTEQLQTSGVWALIILETLMKSPSDMPEDHAKHTQAYLDFDLKLKITENIQRIFDRSIEYSKSMIECIKIMNQKAVYVPTKLKLAKGLGFKLPVCSFYSSDSIQSLVAEIERSNYAVIAPFGRKTTKELREAENLKKEIKELAEMDVLKRWWFYTTGDETKVMRIAKGRLNEDALKRHRADYKKGSERWITKKGFPN
jgi:hypothetical protein